MSEIWKDIPGYEGRYQASTEGRIKSLGRAIDFVNRWGQPAIRYTEDRVLVATRHHTGYLVVKLGNSRQFRVHTLIAATFLGPAPDGMIVSHSDDNKENNSVSNLEYMTSSENVKRAYRTGCLDNRGTTNGKAVLTDEIVRAIRSYPSTMSAPKVAALVGCKKHNVNQVRKGAWSHVA
jgi:hypothetical protein